MSVVPKRRKLTQRTTSTRKDLWRRHHMLKSERMLASDFIEVEESRAGDAHLEPFLACLAGRVGHVPGCIKDRHGAWLESAELVGGEGEGAGIAEDRA